MIGENMIEEIYDMWKEYKGVLLLIVMLCLAVSFGVACAIVPIYKRSIGGQGEFSYTGDVGFVGVWLLNDTAVNVTLTVAVARVYDVSLTVAGVVYEKLGNSWGVGVYSVVFANVTLAVPFKAQILVVEP